MTDATHIFARAARGYLVHKVPSDAAGLLLTSTTAACGFKPTPRGLAEIRWYRAEANARNCCDKCFPAGP